MWLSEDRPTADPTPGPSRPFPIGLTAVCAVAFAMLVVALPLVAGLSLGLMRPGKGVMIALQMRNKAGQTRHEH